MYRYINSSPCWGVGCYIGYWKLHEWVPFLVVELATVLIIVLVVLLTAIHVI